MKNKNIRIVVKKYFKDLFILQLSFILFMFMSCTSQAEPQITDDIQAGYEQLDQDNFTIDASKLPDLVASLKPGTYNIKVTGFMSLQTEQSFKRRVPSGVMLNIDFSRMDMHSERNYAGWVTGWESVFKNCDFLVGAIIPYDYIADYTNCFSGCINLKKVELTRSKQDYGPYDENLRYFREVPYSMFRGCSNLSEVILPYTITTIELAAFEDCSNLTYINLPNNLTTIDTGAFFGCKNLKEIIIPDTVTRIGAQAFEGCESLRNIRISSNVTEMDDYNPFPGCINLKSIVVDENNQNYSSSGGMLFNKEKSILYAYPSASDKVVIPDSVNEISYMAFAYCTDLKEMYFPNNVYIESNSFYGCKNLSNITMCTSSFRGDRLDIFSDCTDLSIFVTIPDGVTSIGDSAFSGCNSLVSIDIPSSVTSIGGSAFSGCNSLVSIDIPSSVTSIGGSAFSGCNSLVSIDIPNSVTSIGNSAFLGCESLVSINIPDSVSAIGYRAFSGCKSLVSVNIPYGITSINFEVFLACESLVSIDIPSSVTSIGDSAFSGCKSLVSIDIPNSVTSIGYSAFSECENLVSISIPESTTKIDTTSGVFSCCQSLINIVVDENNQNYSASGGILFNKDQSILYAYPSATGDIVIPDSVICIYTDAFWHCKNLTNISIPNVTTICYCAFNGCSNLKRISLSEGIKSIPNSVFGGCSSLITIVIPASLKSIGPNAFNGALSLEKVYYRGSEEEWNSIDISYANFGLDNAKIIFNYTGE